MLYPTDLTDDQWQGIKPLLDEGLRKCKYQRRDLFNAVLYIVKAGCQWRMLPKEYPPWQVVYYHFQCLRSSGRLQKLLDALVGFIRSSVKGLRKLPSVAIIDAQSVKSTLVTSSSFSGYDGGKRIKGIKRHIAVDSHGHLLQVKVHSAAVADRKGGAWLLTELRSRHPHIQKIFCDGGYSLVGRAGDTDQTLQGYSLHVVKRNKEKKGFSVVPKRWVVERTFAWIETNRRNAKSYERMPATAEAITQLSTIRILLNQLTKYF